MKVEQAIGKIFKTVELCGLHWSLQTQRPMFGFKPGSRLKSDDFPKFGFPNNAILGLKLVTSINAYD